MSVTAIRMAERATLAFAMRPKLTVITPSFNQAWSLERTIRSVLDQGGAGRQDIRAHSRTSGVDQYTSIDITGISLDWAAGAAANRTRSRCQQTGQANPDNG